VPDACRPSDRPATSAPGGGNTAGEPRPMPPGPPRSQPRRRPPPPPGSNPPGRRHRWGERSGSARGAACRR